MQRVLLLDNYDSFTYNLLHLLNKFDAKVDVYRNDKFDLNSVFNYDKIVLSPGPGLPQNAGCQNRLISMAESKVPIFGVCLGMQAIAVHLGGSLVNQRKVKHGVQEIIDVKQSTVFHETGELHVGLYHSWSVERGKGNFDITSWGKTGNIMGIENNELRMYGVQFHPESIMTPHGEKIVDTFLKM